MWTEENKALVRRFLEAQANADLDTLDQLLAPDFVDHTLLPGQDPSRQGYLRAIVEDHAALSDIGTTIEYQATDGDDIVITRHTAHSIHDRGALLGMEPTGKEWKLTHIGHAPHLKGQDRRGVECERPWSDPGGTCARDARARCAGP